MLSTHADLFLLSINTRAFYIPSFLDFVCPRCDPDYKLLFRVNLVNPVEAICWITLREVTFRSCSAACSRVYRTLIRDKFWKRSRNLLDHTNTKWWILPSKCLTGQWPLILSSIYTLHCIVHAYPGTNILNFRKIDHIPVNFSAPEMNARISNHVRPCENH